MSSLGLGLVLLWVRVQDGLQKPTAWPSRRLSLAAT